MKLSKTKPKKGKKKGQSTPQALFQREWERVQSLQKQNERLKDDVTAFAERVIATIRPVEEAFTQSMYQLAEKLLGFAERKSLARWQREELFDWIEHTLLSLRNHPFAGALDLQALYQRLGEHVDTHFGLDELSDDDDEAAVSDEEEQGFEDMLDELFGEFLEHEGIHLDEDELFGASADTADRAEEQSLNQLLKSSSVNKMFRQIASAIHPDREKDVQRKAHRNAIMSDLVRARDEKDVPKIFAMYAEHVGVSPLECIGDDIEKIITLLKRQSERLRAEKEDIVHANPMYGAIYERFYNKSDHKVNLEVNRHIASVKSDTAAHRQLLNSIANLKILKQALQERSEIQFALLERELDDDEGIPF